MNEEQKAFHLEEYRKLSGELSWMFTAMSSTTQFVLIVAAAVFTWLATQALGTTDTGFCQKLPNELTKWAWYIPLAVSLLAACILLATQFRANDVGHYLQQVEARFGVSPLGWESTLIKKSRVPTIAVSAFWLALIAGTAIAGCQASSFSQQKAIQVCPAAKS